VLISLKEKNCKIFTLCVDIKGIIPLPFIKCLKTLEFSYSVMQWVKGLGFCLMMIFNVYQLLQIVVDTKEGTEGKSYLNEAYHCSVSRQ
jgi:hypothetical protein